MDRTREMERGSHSIVPRSELCRPAEHQGGTDAPSSKLRLYSLSSSLGDRLYSPVLKLILLCLILSLGNDYT